MEGEKQLLFIFNVSQKNYKPFSTISLRDHTGDISKLWTLPQCFVIRLLKQIKKLK